VSKKEDITGERERESGERERMWALFQLITAKDLKRNEGGGEATTTKQKFKDRGKRKREKTGTERETD
jgi:hypothetical protein